MKISKRIQTSELKDLKNQKQILQKLLNKNG